MRAATIVLGVLRLGTCLRHASSFRAAHPPSSSIAAVRVRDNGAAVIIPVTKAAVPPLSASSNRDHTDHADHDASAATAVSTTTTTTTTRRSFAMDAVARFSIVGCSSVLAYLSSSSIANASGGATAGGAYLLSGAFFRSFRPWLGVT